MPKAEDSEAPQSPDLTQQLVRITRLLALVVVKGENQRDKILSLTAAGFSVSEIADLLRTTPNTVSVTVYQSKPKRKPLKQTKKTSKDDTKKTNTR